MDVSHNFREGHTAPFDVLTFWHEERFFSTGQWQWWIQGRDRGADSPLFLDQIEDRRAKKFFFWRPPSPPPYIRVWIIPPLSEGLYLPPGAHNPPPLSRLIEFRFEILVTGSPLLSSRRFSTVHADFIARSLFRSSALTACAKTKDPFKKISLQKCSNIMK